jgi:PAS domain S-box-containing protein
VVALLVAASVGVHIRSEYQKALDEWRARQSSIADDRSRMVSDWLKERTNSAEALATSAVVIALLPPRSPVKLATSLLGSTTQTVARSLDRMARAYGYTGILVLDPQGHPMVRSAGPYLLDGAKLAACRQVVETGRSRIDLWGDVPDESLLTISSPILSEETGERPASPVSPPLGAVVLLIRPAAKLFPVLRSESVPSRSGETVLVRREGNEIVYLTPARHQAVGTAALRYLYREAPLPARAALEGRETFGEFEDYHGVAVLAATRRIPATGWGLVCKIDRAEALAEFRRMAWVEALSAALLLGAFGALLLAYRRHGESVAVRREQERFRALVQATAQIVWTTNPQGEVEDIPEWRAFTGQSVAEVKGWGWNNALHPEDRERIATIWSEAVKNRSLFDVEYRLRRQDGEYRFFNARGVPVLEPDGSVREWVGFCADIHERKRAEELSRRQAALLDQPFDAVFAWEVGGPISYWNQGAQRLYGFSSGEAMGRIPSELLKTDFPTSLQECKSELEREGYWSGDLNQKTRDGRSIVVESRMTLVRQEGGSLVLEANRDVTERKRAEEEIRKLNESLEQRVRERTAELEATNKELESFTYSVSHDLRAPLRHIDGFAKLLVEEYSRELPEKARHYLTRVRGGTQRMGQMVDELLNLSRVRRRELSVRMTGLNSLVNEVKRQLEPDTTGRAIEWRIDSLPFVECDPALMTQVFANLLSNAVKFTRPRPQAVIEVGARNENGQTVFFVRDNGVGFSMKYVDKLFGAFQRLHRQEDFEGTGVGLATVQRIIHKHGGRVWTEAELNKGATFYFTLGTAPAAIAARKGEAACQIGR